MEVKDELTGDKFTQAVGQLSQRMQEQFRSQPSHQRAVGVAVGSDTVDVLMAERTGGVTCISTAKSTACASTEAAWGCSILWQPSVRQQRPVGTRAWSHHSTRQPAVSMWFLLWR